MIFGVFFCVLGLLCKREGKEEDANPDKVNEKNNEEAETRKSRRLYRRKGESSFFFYVLVSAGISVPVYP